MLLQQSRPAVAGRPLTDSPPLDTLAPGWPAAAGEFEWLRASLGHQFWQPSDLARSALDAGAFTPQQREAIAYWWSLLAAVEGLGPMVYAAAFVRASEQHENDEVRGSLVAMLRDELDHEQLCRLAMERLAPGWPLQYEPQTALARQAHRHLRQVYQEADRYWHGYQRALDEHGIGVVSGALLLRELVAGSLYEVWASSCTIPAFATAFRHTARDAQRHHGVLQALVARDWPLLSAPQRSEAAAQVQATTRLLSTVVLEPAGQGDLPDDPASNQRACAAAACQVGLGVPTAEQRRELLRTALLDVKTVLRRYDIPVRVDLERARQVAPHTAPR